MLGCQIYDENDDDENVPLNYYITNDLSIQFGREEFCLVTGLKFGVENWEEYDNQENLPFRRRLFSSHLDGQPITGIDIENAISGPTFAELYDDDTVGLCCLGNLQLVLLGAENRRMQTSNVGHNSMSKRLQMKMMRKRIHCLDILGHSRVAAWRKKNGRFLAEMVIPFFEGNIHAARLTPDDNEARSD
ncbi:hypothetical protein Tco_0534352 [Tanacetum coccineum]